MNGNHTAPILAMIREKRGCPIVRQSLFPCFLQMAENAGLIFSSSTPACAAAHKNGEKAFFLCGLFAVFHCRSLRGHTFCMNRKYAKNHKRGGDCVFPAPFESPPLNRRRETVRGFPLIPSKWRMCNMPCSIPHPHNSNRSPAKRVRFEKEE